MIDPLQFVDALLRNGVTNVTGVPDSLLKSVCACIAETMGEGHVPATNEGSAVGLALGWYLGTGRPPLVYMQNSGLGNAVNPLVSLADPEVWGIPMILLIGWRAEMMQGGQLKDEPQHVKQGAITEKLLNVLGIPYAVLDAQTEDIFGAVTSACETSLRRRGPFALLARKDTFADYPLTVASEEGLSREKAIAGILDAVSPEVRIVATTGMASRELFELRELRGEGHSHDILTVGGMGHASQIAAGLALGNPEKRIVCLDGDGALLMHAGGLSITAGISNLTHVVINNRRHDSVGGQPTRAVGLDLVRIARSFGHVDAVSVSQEAEIRKALGGEAKSPGPRFVEIRCRPGARQDLGRPTISARSNVDEFMAGLDKEESQ